MSTPGRPPGDAPDGALPGSLVPDDVPERLVARMVGRVADLLGTMETAAVPVPLRRVAAFTPARRARLGRTAILAALEDEEFRADVVRRLEEGDAADDPDDRAAVALLARSPGWADEVAEAAVRQRRTAEQVAVAETESRVAALQRRVDELSEALEERRRRAREESGELRAANADLRRKLGQTRSDLRREREESARLVGELAALREEREQDQARAEGELRRVRSELERLEEERERRQRADRTGRDEATLRARLLLDTLLQAGQGLRQELALPVVEGEPADAVAASLPEEGVAVTSGHGSLAASDPTLLRELLALPRVHVIVDGYNVTKSAWPEAALDVQRDRLVRGVAPLVARTGASLTVVFDAAQMHERPVVGAPRGVRVLFSPFGRIADDVIRDLVAVEPPGRAVVVVTDDRAVLADVRRHPGVRTAGSSALAHLIA